MSEAPPRCPPRRCELAGYADGRSGGRPETNRNGATKKAPADAEALSIAPARNQAILLERCLHAGEGGDETSANSLHNSDDCNRDAGRDQPIFDRGSTRLVLKEAIQKVKHVPDLQGFSQSTVVPLTPGGFLLRYSNASIFTNSLPQSVLACPISAIVEVGPLGAAQPAAGSAATASTSTNAPSRVRVATPTVVLAGGASLLTYCCLTSEKIGWFLRRSIR